MSCLKNTNKHCKKNKTKQQTVLSQEERHSFDNASLLGYRSRSETRPRFKTAKRTSSLFFMENMLSAQTLEMQNSSGTSKHLGLSSSFCYNIKKGPSFHRPLVAQTAAVSAILPSTCFFPARVVSPAKPRPSAHLRVTQLSGAGLGSGTSGSPRDRSALASSPPAVTSAGPVWCHDADRIAGKQNFTGLSSVGDTFPGCTRGRRRRRRRRRRRAPFRGCEKRGGIPFEAGSSAVRKSGPR